ncbi:protein phosphatase 1 regulatory subunit 7 [Cryptosporidium andersoni]|uniref:Protein phosphatase 1 regulatory subunit 7 n=1 Tax=Cryptosporidium andersoni TaxID=117008 RepID=A0A1J4MS00_9CRYT|nr:protein phosphatase 1 regulatory subunit 7 [Cryptosporidium andersoni]
MDTIEERSTNSNKSNKISLLRLGIDHLVSEDDEIINIQCGRIGKIENLYKCKNLRALILISNHIEKIENLSELRSLNILELYQNSIRKIEDLDELINLEVLDLSFNKIQKVENLDNLKNLRKLFLSSNRINIIEGLDNNTKLTLLELGGNRIRHIGNIEHLIQLEELWLGRNKITNFESLPNLVKLKSLSLQSNRLSEWALSFQHKCCNLKELYLSHNKLPSPPIGYFKNFKQLHTLDLAANEISNLEEISNITSLEELWLNDNCIDSLDQIELLKKLKNMKTLYIERNPLQLNLGPAYRMKILEILPWISQLDALSINSNIYLTSD